jgi:dihydrofolate reductase
MARLVLKMSMSLDGFIAGAQPGSDWMLRASTPDSAAWVLDTLAGASAHLIGRRTFESWISFWPTSTSPMAAPLNDIPKVVFTRQKTFDPRALGHGSAPSSARAAWSTSRVACGDLTSEIERVKREPGDYVLAQGGVSFCQSLVKAALVDEYRFAISPVALGSGERLFTGLDDELDLELVTVTAFSGGALGAVYRPRPSA